MKNTITMAQRVALADFLRRDYSDSAMTDGEFAAHAAEMLGFAVNRNNVLTLRVALGMPSNHKPKATRPQEPAEDWAAVARDLQSRVERLEFIVASVALGQKGPA